MEFKIEDIYDKNINFLIGSGASHGLFPTLDVEIKGNDNTDQSIESLATYFDKSKNDKAKALVLMHYFKTCIEPIINFDFEVLELIGGTPTEEKVIENYTLFLKTILEIINKKKSNDLKTCNIFTTNYDVCMVYVADKLIKGGKSDFIINDGARGFLSRYLSAKNYNTQTQFTGPFERYSSWISQINLIPLHGSVAWQKENDEIKVDYSKRKTLSEDILKTIPKIDDFSKILNDNSKKVSNLESVEITISEEKFLESYNKLPIVNPTKWKFHETVFEEHYYQMLRYLSYELEKPNTVLITFGFSFRDEHILNLIKRSLSNPTLQLFVSCFNEKEHNELKKKFDKFSNITFLCDPTNVDFSKFNSRFFNLYPKAEEEIGEAP